MRILLNKLSSNGATALEFALVFPIFALLICGIMEFGWYFHVQHTIQFATREGTRLALVGGQLEDKEGKLLNRADSIVKAIKDNAAGAVDTNNLNISIFPVGPGYTDPEEWNTMINAGTGGDYMRVRVLYTFTFNTPLIGNFFPSGAKIIHAEALYRNELFTG